MTQITFKKKKHTKGCHEAKDWHSDPLEIGINFFKSSQSQRGGVAKVCILEIASMIACAQFVLFI